MKKINKIISFLFPILLFSSTALLTSCSSDNSTSSTSENSQNNNNNNSNISKKITISESPEFLRRLDREYDKEYKGYAYSKNDGNNKINTLEYKKKIKEDIQYKNFDSDWNKEYYQTIPLWFNNMLYQYGTDYLNKFSSKGRIARDNDVDYAVYYFEYLLRNNKDYIKILFNIENNDWESIKNDVNFIFSITNKKPTENGVLVTFNVQLQSTKDSVQIVSQTGGNVETTFDFYLASDFMNGDKTIPKKGGALYIDTSKINNSIENFSVPLIANFNKLCKSYVLQYDWNDDGVKTTNYIPTKEQYENGIKKWAENRGGTYNIDNEYTFYMARDIPIDLDFHEIKKLGFIKRIWGQSISTSQLIDLNTDEKLLEHFFGFNIFNSLTSFNIQLNTLNLDKILKDTNFCFNIDHSAFVFVKSSYGNWNGSSILSDLILDANTKQRISIESVVSKFTHNDLINYNRFAKDQYFAFSVGQYFVNGLFNKYTNRQ